MHYIPSGEQYTNSFIGQYGVGGQQQPYGGPPAQSPAGYGAQPMGYAGPPSAGAYGRGQQPPNQPWTQPPPNHFPGYQA